MTTDLERAREGRHVPALDGVRGLAILLVLIYHCILYGGMRPELGIDRLVRRAASGGWAGVDLFFVLSGFLITGILLKSRNSPTYFRSFYARRVLRIFPLYFSFLAIFIWVLPHVRPMGADFALLEREQLWYWTYLVNIRIAFEGWPEYGALGHFWSLAVEEQFYLVWPLIVYACRRETLLKVCGACLVIPLLVRIGLVLADQATAAQVLTITRLDALATGALLAIWIRQPGAPGRTARVPRVVLIVCLVVLGMMFARYQALWAEIPMVNSLGLSLIALAGGSLLATILLSQGSRRIPRIFEHPFLVFLGKYSYGIYVLHHPLIIFLGTSRLAASEWPRLFGSQIPGQLFVILAGTGLSIGAALLSWHLVEAPFLRLKRFFPYAPRES